VVHYRDKMGRDVAVRAPVRRAVLYETYEVLPATGAWGQVAGLSRYAFGNDLILAARPGIASEIPSAGSAMDANAEELLRLDPDVVLTWTVNAKSVRFLERKGLTVIAVNPESIAELYDVMRLQGSLFGKEKRVDAVIGRMEKMFALIRERTGRIPAAERKKAVWLCGKPTMVAGRVGVNNDLLTIAGLVNCGRGIERRSTDVSLEKILLWNPEIVFIWGSARYSAADLLDNPQWRHIEAVRTRSVRKAPHWSTWSPRLAPIALWMASTAYPELFRDIDVRRETDHFYRDVYGIPYQGSELVAR
jgi:iron complex transport system substrate-binding protein